jgi:predicted TPR repeat methyltransferase
MLSQAEARGIYDGLTQGDLVEYLDRSTESFDAIVAADVFVYLGDLDPCVRAVRTVAADDARFAFSTEISEGADFVLQRTGRFAHQRSYVEALAKRHQFEVRSRRERTLRLDHGEPIVGNLFLLG